MSVPSFSSFPDLDPGPSKQPSKPKGAKKVRQPENLKPSSQSKYKRQKYTSVSLALNDEKLKEREDVKRLENEQSRHFFYSDRKGDDLNIRYGGLHAGDVPKYHTVDRGRRILGLSFAWVASYRSGKGVEVGPSNRRKMPGLTDPGSQALLALAPRRRIIQFGDNYKHKEVDGFLRLPSLRGHDLAEPSYRSITVSKNDNISDSESSTCSQDDDDLSTEDDIIELTSYQETLKTLDQQLAMDPSSEEEWLLLLSHTLSTIPITSKNATKARSEITLSILMRAFSADKRNAYSTVLLLKYLKAGEEVWHESKTRAEWEDALKVGEIDIYMEWLEWKIRKGNKGIDSVVGDAARVLNVLQNDEAGEIGKVRVFWRMAIAFQDAGFFERATAMFQAQAELTFKAPEALHSLHLQDQLDHLEEFWESEVPRVGEEQASGWAAWVSSSQQEHIPTPSFSALDLTPNLVEVDPYRQWAIQEVHTDRTRRLPVRSTDEEGNSDPYATILFSDIRPLLMILRSHRAKHAFRLAWLSVAQLHIPGFSASLSHTNWDDRWNCGYLTKRGYLHALFPADGSQRRITTDAVAGVLIGREKEYANGVGPIRYWGYGVFGPLDVQAVGEGLQLATDRRGWWEQKDVEGMDSDFWRCIFIHLRLGMEDLEWDMLALAFEAAGSVKSAWRLSRSFLSTACNTLPYWRAHAQLERMRGRLDDARKVYQASLAASKLSGVGQIWWDWTEMEWLAGNSDEAFKVILRSTGVEAGHGGVVALRARRSLEDTTQMIQDSIHWKERESWIKLLALLELLLAKEVAPAFTIFDKYLAQSNDVVRESMTVASLLMIYRYGVILKNPMPPSVLRERVECALDEYPSNSVIMGLFLEGEKGQGVWGRVRGRLGENGGEVKDISRRVAEVWIAGWERGRWEGEIERTRSGLAAAVEHERTRASSILWRIYIEFEIRTGQLQQAKKLVYRAIGECPLCKELYLVAFGPLRTEFSREELDGLGEAMGERGLRLRQGLVEWEGRREAVDEEDGSGDEIEEQARELRRLMPFGQ